MSGGGIEAPVGCEAAPSGGGGRKTPAGSAHLVIKDLGEIHSRLLDHRPVIQGETRYFVKEFEEKRGLREMRVLENLKNMIHETNEHTLPKCRETMQDYLNQVLQRLQAANDSVCRLQQREQERKKSTPTRKKALTRCTAWTVDFPASKTHLSYQYVSSPCAPFSLELWNQYTIHNDHLIASEKQHILQWEDFMKEQPNKRAEVDEEHRKAMERLKEQYAEMEKDLAKFSTF
ncbi:biogenesis of lysosome-related organelles complex 1 subunit 5 isoform X1 [Cynocephalus volans]|uniref:biogenesis of lysosome-related organelles complex 1 subunit 5 isoform X1 n=1 Tax=Cynocephalus volans TaxID=110931 RepID=UPI002FC78FC1